MIRRRAELSARYRFGATALGQQADIRLTHILQICLRETSISGKSEIPKPGLDFYMDLNS